MSLKCPSCGTEVLPFRTPHCSGLTCQRCKTVLSVTYDDAGQPLTIEKSKRGNILATMPVSEVVYANL